jgi:hypothetical protein
MSLMDDFLELGITASAEAPHQHSATREFGEVVTAMLAGTAITAVLLSAVLVVAGTAVAIYFAVQFSHSSLF